MRYICSAIAPDASGSSLRGNKISTLRLARRRTDWTRNLQQVVVFRPAQKASAWCLLKVRAGVPETVAMSISGHKTRSMFDRYNSDDERDQREALRATQAYREQQAAMQRERLAKMPAMGRA
jgi:hypothetical protein